MNKNKTFRIDVVLKNVLWKQLHTASYAVPLNENFVKSDKLKSHGFKNHVKAFVEKIIENCKPLVKQSYTKWSIYVVRYGMNIGSEMNGDRPSLIYKSSHHTFGEDIIVIPLTSVTNERLIDSNDVLVHADKENSLYKNSYARLRQIRAVSVKRVGKAIGKITNPDLKAAINLAVKKMLATDHE